jgi:hypothetical protein
VSPWRAGWRPFVATAVIGGALYASERHGIPRTLPSPALGWPLLFHMERAIALLALTGSAALVLWRALKGEFPVRFGQLEYPAQESAETAKGVAEALERRVQMLEALSGIGNPPPES